MSSTAESFKINLNQNLWGLLLAFGFLGIAEYYELCALFWLSLFVAVVMIVSVTASTWAYTTNYWKDKNK